MSAQHQATQSAHNSQQNALVDDLFDKEAHHADDVRILIVALRLTSVLLAVKVLHGEQQAAFRFGRQSLSRNGLI